MRRITTYLLILAGALFAGLVFAQDAGPGLDLATWFTSTAALGAVVAFIVAQVRKHIWASLDGFYVVIFSVAVGALLGIIGRATGYLSGGLADALLFGAGAGWLASGGVDLLRSLGGAKPAVASSTRTDEARLRTR